MWVQRVGEIPPLNHSPTLLKVVTIDGPSDDAGNIVAHRSLVERSVVTESVNGEHELHSHVA